jgi:hypothetical protein
VAIEKWIGAASLGLFIMFVAEILSVFNFLTHPNQEIEPGPKILEFISIGVVPALILAGSSFMLSRRYGSRLIGSMIIAGGAVTLVGMYYASTLLSHIGQSYLVTEVTITPPLFMATSIPTMIVGSLLFRIKPKPKKDYFFDG